MDLLCLLSGLFMAWGLGANATAVFGTAVATTAVRYRTAMLLTAIFALAGAALEGDKCLKVFVTLLERMGTFPVSQALVCSLAAALIMALMSSRGLPVSTSQAAIGAVVGITWTQGQVQWGSLAQVVICWLLTPVGAGVVSYLLYLLVAWLVHRYVKTDRVLNLFITYGMIFAGCYGAYSLGANHVANATGVFYVVKVFSGAKAAWIGGFGIALGAMTYGRKVMQTIGTRITPLSPLASLVVVLAEAMTVHLYTQLGIPVSTSQALVGAVAGIGFVRGIRTVNRKLLLEIFGAWVATPVLAGLAAWFGTRLLAWG